MKTNKLAAASLLLSLGLLALQIGQQLASAQRGQASATAVAAHTEATTPPTFIQVGKDYIFNVGYNASEYAIPVVLKGRVEKVDAGTGWVYLTHYIETRKGKVIEGKFGGGSWINLNHVYQCTEITLPPTT